MFMDHDHSPSISVGSGTVSRHRLPMKEVIEARAHQPWLSSSTYVQPPRHDLELRGSSELYVGAIRNEQRKAQHEDPGTSKEERKAIQDQGNKEKSGPDRN